MGGRGALRGEGRAVRVARGKGEGFDVCGGWGGAQDGVGRVGGEEQRHEQRSPTERRSNQRQLGKGKGVLVDGVWGTEPLRLGLAAAGWRAAKV